MYEQTAKLKKNVSLKKEEFDWDIYEKGQSNIEKLKILTGESIPHISEGEIVKATIIRFLEKEVILDVNFKSEGVISINEFRYNPNFKLGEEVDVYVEKLDFKGELLLSHRKAKTLLTWKRVNEAYKNDEIITGIITGRTKGGMIVNIEGIEAFLPGSQVDNKPLVNFDNFFNHALNKKMEFKVIKINHEYKNIVVSHQAILEAFIEKQKKKNIYELKTGNIIMATIKNIKNYGALCDICGIDGFIHKTDISWKRINHPESALKINDYIKVVVLGFNEEKKRIKLGLKQIMRNPWKNLDLSPGDKVKGFVTAVTEYGAFIELNKFPGVEALLHVSEMSWSSQLRMAKDFVKIGDVIEGVILTIDINDKKMSLGTKQLMPNPWMKVKYKYPRGSKHTGIVRTITNYGVFIELEDGVEGMIHNDDISWDKKFSTKSLKQGSFMEVIIIELDINAKRIRLGHKQLQGFRRTC